MKDNYLPCDGGATITNGDLVITPDPNGDNNWSLRTPEAHITSLYTSGISVNLAKATTTGIRLETFNETTNSVLKISPNGLEHCSDINENTVDWKITSISDSTGTSSTVAVS